MAVIKCKMCGGDLELVEGSSVCECEYCGTKQTVPTADNDKKLTLFARANRLRTANEFDKAAGVYENLVADFPEEAEAYWGLVLCRYGIEYVDDPATGKKIPTCHRSSFDSILEDEDFEQACENADSVARRVYRDEAKAIEDIRRGILEISGKEEPYDIFICYKETDDSGNRTIDSVIAQDLYDALTEKGYRVFFSRITLEDKLGQEYEPYIFAALNSAKIMLAVGTDYEHYNAVWVKNEWSRFLALIANGQKKTLIPCYKDLDAYDMPKEFQRLQAQDMGKVGAVQDLLRGIEKIVSLSAKKLEAQSGFNVEKLLRRGELALEDEDWDNAQDFFNRVLDMDPESADAYLGLAMTSAQCHNRDHFAAEYTKLYCNWRDSSNLKRVKQFGNNELLSWLDLLDEQVQKIKENAEKTAKLAREQAEENAKAESEEMNRKRQEKYAAALIQMEKAASMVEYRQAASAFNAISGYLDADSRRERCERQAKQLEWDEEWKRREQLLKDRRARERSEKLAENKILQKRREWSKKTAAIIDANEHLIGVQVNGKVLSLGRNSYGQCDVTEWTNIVAIATGDRHTVGLKRDGTVTTTGSNDAGQCNVNEWSNIKAIAAGGGHTVGLKTDGTVVATGENEFGQCNVTDWKDIIALFCGRNHTLGLKRNGTVVASGRNLNHQLDVDNWTNIVSLSTGANHTIGLKSDGTVVAVGTNQYGQCDVDKWTDIVAVSVSDFHSVGLTSDGFVCGVGRNNDGECMSMDDIVCIVACNNRTVELRKDGRVFILGKRFDSRPKFDINGDASSWKLFHSVDTIDDERATAMRVLEEREADSNRIAAECAEQERKERTAALVKEQTTLNSELSNLKGLFSGKRKKQIQFRLEVIETELKTLE